jgi:hypothetical protein
VGRQRAPARVGLGWEPEGAGGGGGGAAAALPRCHGGVCAGIVAGQAAIGAALGLLKLHMSNLWKPPSAAEMGVK